MAKPILIVRLSMSLKDEIANIWEMISGAVPDWNVIVFSDHEDDTVLLSCISESQAKELPEKDLSLIKKILEENK